MGGWGGIKSAARAASSRSASAGSRGAAAGAAAGKSFGSILGRAGRAAKSYSAKTTKKPVKRRKSRNYTLGGWTERRAPGGINPGKISFIDAPNLHWAGSKKAGPSAQQTADVEQAKKSQLEALARGEQRAPGLQDQHQLLQTLATLMGQAPDITSVRERRAGFEGGLASGLRQAMAASGLVGSAGQQAPGGALVSGMADIKRRGFQMQTAGEAMAKAKNLQQKLASAGALQSAIAGRAGAAAPFTMAQANFYGGTQRPYTA